jgi:hypothetical protein
VEDPALYIQAKRAAQQPLMIEPCQLQPNIPALHILHSDTAMQADCGYYSPIIVLCMLLARRSPVGS